MLIETKEQDGVRLDAVVFASENGEMSKKGDQMQAWGFPSSF